MKREKNPTHVTRMSGTTMPLQYQSRASVPAPVRVETGAVLVRSSVAVRTRTVAAAAAQDMQLTRSAQPQRCVAFFCSVP